MKGAVPAALSHLFSAQRTVEKGHPDTWGGGRAAGCVGCGLTAGSSPSLAPYCLRPGTYYLTFLCLSFLSFKIG